MSQLIKIIRKNSELSEVETENNVAISQFIASACFFITTFIILTTYFSSTSHPLIIQACNVVFTCLYGLSYFILKKTKARFGKITLLLTSFLQSSCGVIAFGIHDGIELYFFSAFVLCFVLFKKEEHIVRNIFLFLALTLFGVFNYLYIFKEVEPIIAYSHIRNHFVFLVFNSIFNFLIIGLSLFYFNKRYNAFKLRLTETIKINNKILRQTLPKQILRRIQSGELHIAEKFSDVTVIFADIVNFTSLAERFSPEKIVKILDSIFSEIDLIAKKRGLEKIKTIGDAYMAIAKPEKGGYGPKNDHVYRTIEMGKDILRFIKVWGQKHALEMDFRVGIHTGPSVGGVIGLNKFSYDIWGDTVNTASRMESHGLPGNININHDTYFKVKDKYPFKSIGKVFIKGKGSMEIYVLQKNSKEDF